MTEHELAFRKDALREFKYLPLFYMIPDDYAKRRELDIYPRDPMLFATDPYWQQAYQDKYFEAMLMDTWALMIWEGFDIRGGFVNYSSNEPFVRLAVNLPLWVEVAARLGITTDRLAEMQPGEEMPFLTLRQSAHNVAVMAKFVWDSPGFKLPEILEVVEQHRCHEDYSQNKSHIRVDFHRQYYHSRSSRAKQVPLEEETDDTTTYGYTPNEFGEMESRVWLETFAEEWLEERDQQILTLLCQGYTQKEIAKILGYANHSGVNKRLQSIRHNLQRYMEEDRQLFKWLDKRQKYMEEEIEYSKK